MLTDPGPLVLRLDGESPTGLAHGGGRPRALASRLGSIAAVEASAAGEAVDGPDAGPPDAQTES